MKCNGKRDISNAIGSRTETRRAEPEEITCCINCRPSAPSLSLLTEIETFNILVCHEVVDCWDTCHLMQETGLLRRKNLRICENWFYHRSTLDFASKRVDVLCWMVVNEPIVQLFLSALQSIVGLQTPKFCLSLAQRYLEAVVLAHTLEHPGFQIHVPLRHGAPVRLRSIVSKSISVFWDEKHEFLGSHSRVTCLIRNNKNCRLIVQSVLWHHKEQNTICTHQSGIKSEIKNVHIVCAQKNRKRNTFLSFYHVSRDLCAKVSIPQNWCRQSIWGTSVSIRLADNALCFYWNLSFDIVNSHCAVVGHRFPHRKYSFLWNFPQHNPKFAEKESAYTGILLQMQKRVDWDCFSCETCTWRMGCFRALEQSLVTDFLSYLFRVAGVLSPGRLQRHLFSWQCCHDDLSSIWKDEGWKVPHNQLLCWLLCRCFALYGQHLFWKKILCY